MNSHYRSLTTLAVAAACVSLTMIVSSEQSAAQSAIPNAESNRFMPARLRVDSETATPQAAQTAAGTQTFSGEWSSSTILSGSSSRLRQPHQRL